MIWPRASVSSGTNAPISEKDASLRQAFIPTGLGYLRQKGFRVAVSIRPPASGEQGQPVGSITAQIPVPLQAGSPKKEQREQKPLAQSR